MSQPTLVETDEASLQPEATAAIEGRAPLQLAWTRLRNDKVALAALAVILLLIVMAVFAPLLVKLTGHPPNIQYRETGLTPDGLPVGPFTSGSEGRFLLGSDGVGRDILSRIIYGSRVSLIVGVAATGLSLVIGVTVGLIAGYYGGRVDTVLSGLMDLILSFPQLLFAIALIAVLDSRSILIIIGIIAFFGWVVFARIVRGQVLSLREKEFVEAARSLGASDMRIIFIDILPNLVAPIIIYATLIIPANIITEAALSFLGLGIVEPTATWGNMLSQSISYYRTSWWYFTFPGLALLITVLAWNLLGDGLRDALDPRVGRTTAKR